MDKVTEDSEADALAAVLAVGMNWQTGDRTAVSPPQGTPAGSDATPDIPGFRIIGLLGEGGMGTVYEAEQDRPRRRVALKLVRAAVMTPAMLRRFEYEADVLGRLDHPGIARIHHAGIAHTPRGSQPFFAMELVRGTPLHQWVREKDPPRRRRLELLVAVCRAVHHAHTKGVVHRDLKPSNILVTADGEPKVLDFGVARATDSDVQCATLCTEPGALVGTLPYMAPEQAAGKPEELDTSSDVYALGVIAYELLSGRMPYAVESKPLHEAVRIICEQEPARLSGINRALRGDVETIVGKALSKERSRRYQTAGELGADVRRHLDYEPIAARGPGTWYQLAKFARRNKLLVSAVGVMLLLLAGGVVVSSIFAVRARRSAATANELSESLVHLFDSANADVPKGRDYTIRQLLDHFASNLGNKLERQPEAEAALQTTIGMGYRHVGEVPKAEKHLARAMELRRRVFGEHHEKYADSLVNYAWAIEYDKARGRETEKYLVQARQIYRARGVGGQPLLRVLGLLQGVYLREGREKELDDAAEEEDAESIRTYGKAYLDNGGLCLGPLAREAPARPEYIGFLGIYLNLSRELAAAGKTREADAANQKVRALLEELRNPPGKESVSPGSK